MPLWAGAGVLPLVGEQVVSPDAQIASVETPVGLASVFW